MKLQLRSRHRGGVSVRLALAGRVVHKQEGRRKEHKFKRKEAEEEEEEKERLKKD